MARAVDEALEKLGVDRIDVFHLHAARASADVFQVRAGAHKALLDAKRDGKIRAVGISAHSVKTVEAAAGRDDVDVVFPLVNLTGIGLGGTITALLTDGLFGSDDAVGYSMALVGVIAAPLAALVLRVGLPYFRRGVDAA
jgi:predicted oxidoreductase